MVLQVQEVLLAAEVLEVFLQKMHHFLREIIDLDYHLDANLNSGHSGKAVHHRIRMQI